MNGANWSGGTVPSPLIGLLSFPDLGASCNTGTPTAACYNSVDDLGPATVNELQIGGGQEYQIFPNSSADTITLLGNGGTPNLGLVSKPSGSNLQLANFGVPIILGAAQEWDASNYGIVYLNTVSGSFPLTLNLANGWVQANDVETSSVTISGPGELQLDQSAGSPEKLPTVTVNDANGTESALAVATPNATSGPITIAGTANNFIVLTNHAPGETTLAVTGNVTLDSSTNVEFDIDGNNTAAGVDSSQLTTAGTVSLNGAMISLWQAQNSGRCTTLTPGTTYTLLRGGTLTGQIKVGGHLISQGQSATETFQSNSCSGASQTSAIVKYNSQSITATIAGTPASPISKSLLALIRADLAKIAHPSGRRAIAQLLRTRVFRTRFHAPTSGVLSVVWTATVRTGHGRHARHHTFVIARGSVVAHRAGTVWVTIRLTGIGRRLLRADPFHLPVTAIEKFKPTGGRWVTYITRFNL